MREPTTPVVLAEDWQLLCEALPAVPDDELAAMVLAHVRIVAAAGEEAPEVAFARRAGAAAADRALAVVSRARLAEVVPRERRAYEELTRLRTELVPAMKRRARRARDEIVALEREAGARGLEPDAVEPRIGDDAIALDEGPRYETDADRRRTVAEFFGRTGGPRR